MLLAALLIFGLSLVGRLTFRPQAAPLVISGAPPVPVEAGSGAGIAAIQERIRRNPDDAAGYAALGLGLLQQVRETGDAGLYTQAGQAFDEALKRDPEQLEALIGQGSLALSRHQFAAAIEWGNQALALNPSRAAIYGVIGDAQVELGRYDESVATIQQMVNTRPDLSSYSRVSYLRELHGDSAGAITAMQQAVEAGGLVQEQTLWTQVQLGHLFFNRGDLVAAEAAYRRTLQSKPNYAYAIAGIARVHAAQGKLTEAIALYRELVDRLPLPEFVIALGEALEASGDRKGANEQYALVNAMQQLNADAGMNVDLELALFEAAHGSNPAKAVERARAAYGVRPTIYAADALAWALHRAERNAEAQPFATEALRLGTQDASLYYHAGMIAHALGDTATARTHLERALAINPYFSVLHADESRQLVKELGGG